VPPARQGLASFATKEVKDNATVCARSVGYQTYQIMNVWDSAIVVKEPS